MVTMTKPLDLTAIDPVHLIELRLKYLRIILVENSELVEFAELTREN